VSANPFASAEAWETSTDTMMGIGPHVATIIEQADSTAKSSGNPVLELKFENGAGETIRDWLPYNEGFLAKVVALYDSAGLERPDEGEFDPSDHCRLTAKKINQLGGKKIGIMVRDEDDDREVGKKRRRVAGYVTPSRITEEMAADTRGLSTSSSTKSKNDDDDIPF
jgi:hypothetical protein